MEIIERERSKFGSLFFYIGAFSMFVVVTVASCTSDETFAEIYKLVTEFLSISKTSLSMTLRENAALGHFLSYALLSFFLAGIFSRRHLFFAPMIAVVFGILMEIVQIFIPSRGASVMDIGVDILGILLGLGVYLVFVKFVEVRSR